MFCGSINCNHMQQARPVSVSQKVHLFRIRRNRQAAEAPAGPEIFERRTGWMATLPDRSREACIFPSERIVTPLLPDNVLRRCIHRRALQREEFAAGGDAQKKEIRQKKSWVDSGSGKPANVLHTCILGP